jgi:hypothetical protein
MKERVPIKNKIGAFLIIALSGFVLKLTYLFASRIWRVDLYYYIDAAKTMLSGGVLYRDFGCSHPPLGYFEFYWMARLFGYDNMYLTIKIGALVIQTLTAYIVYLIFTRIHNSKTGLVRALLFLALISLSTDFWPTTFRSPLCFRLSRGYGVSQKTISIPVRVPCSFSGSSFRARRLSAPTSFSIRSWSRFSRSKTGDLKLKLLLLRG